MNPGPQSAASAASGSADRAIPARISVNGVCFPKASLQQDIATWRALGARTVTEHVRKFRDAGWDGAVAALSASGLRVESLVHPAEFRLDDPGSWEPARADLRRSIDAARALQARSIYMTSGNRGKLTWEQAADGFSAALQPLLGHASAAGVQLLIEPTIALHADKSIVHTLRDTVRLAELSGLGVCLDIFHCWTEPDLQDAIRRAAPLCGLVQVSDYVFGDKELPCRAVPGDGDIPLERIIGWLLDAGYQGVFDLELNGPRIEREGGEIAVRRATAWLQRVLAA